MSLVITVKVNNKPNPDLNVQPVIITDGRPIISWSWLEELIAIPDSDGAVSGTSFIDQYSYEIRIGTSTTNWGTSAFVGNMDFLTEESTTRQYVYRGKPLQRGSTYYGQLKIIDANGDTASTDWIQFAFKYNLFPSSLDSSTDIEMQGVMPFAKLIANYAITDADSGVNNETFTSIVRWYRNGVYERQFDNQLMIDSQYLSYGDVWSFDIAFSDGYEIGPRTASGAYTIASTTPVADNLTIIPSNPNENDILRAKYDLDISTEEDKSLIRWFINNRLVSTLNDKQYIRARLNANDIVRFELTPYDGARYGTTVSSSTVTVKSADFLVDNLTVEGRKEPLDILTTRPIFAWDVHKSLTRDVSYISIRVGTFAGSDNVYSTVINSNATAFQMPSNLLNRGSDYWVSVAVSDTNEFKKYAIAHFRTTGSLWEATVNNTWTIELSFLGITKQTYDEKKYQVLKIQDGVKFCELRIYADRLAFASKTVVFSGELDFTKANTVTICGTGSNARVYHNRKLVIDATGLLLQDTTSKKLEIGTIASGALEVKYRSIFYTTDKYAPLDNSLLETMQHNWGTLQFASYATLAGQELTAIEGFSDDSKNIKYLGANPHDEDKGGAIYSVGDGSPVRFSAVNRTFSPINRIGLSSNQQYKAFAHARGGTLFYSYLINQWTHEMDFLNNGQIPDATIWELVNNTGSDAVVVNADGLTIDTTFANIGRVNV